MRASLLSLLLLAPACGGDSTSGQDASTDANTTTTDARVDAGRDGSIQDSGGFDTGVVDTGVDSAVSVDSGPSDAGFDACPGTSLTATAAQLCMEFCQGNLWTFCSGQPDAACATQCLADHQDGVKTATQRGNMLACAQAVTSAASCGTFGSCYTIAASCP